MTRRVRIGFVLLALSLAVVCLFRAHGWEQPFGLGQTVMQYVLLGAVLICAQLEGRLRWNRTGILLLSVSVMLGGTYALFGNVWMRALNLPVVWATSVQALFELTGQNEAEGLSGAGIWEGIRRFFVSLVRFFSYPFRFVTSKWSKHRPVGLAAGITIAVPVVLLVLLLLSTADDVFGGWLSG